MKINKCQNFAILYGGCGKIGSGTLEMLLKKEINVINIDPNFKKYINKKNKYYYGIGDVFSEEGISEFNKTLIEYNKNYNFLGIVNFSRISILNDKEKLSSTNKKNNEIFQIMLFDFVKIIDKLLENNMKDFSIVHLSSLNAMQVSHQSILYHSVKGAIESLSKSIAYKLASKNIRSNVIIPALVNQIKNRNCKKSKLEINSIPLKRGAPNESDIAELVFFLLSRKSLCITGSSILIDSGMSLPDAYTTLKNFVDNN